MSLDCFLLGTLDPNSPIRFLRGQRDVMKIIFTLACEERWDLHIEKFPHLDGIPSLTPWGQSLQGDDSEDDDENNLFYSEKRQRLGGCAVATVANNVTFPDVSILPPHTIPNQQDDILYINMMPFVLRNMKTLPSCCQPYIPLIQACMRLIPTSQRDIAYLSIDERPVQIGAPQRRGGVHVESPGVLPVPGLENVVQAGKFVPGIEHGWGNGLMVRSEYVYGGIFLASNIANTTAIWNCRVRNDGGDIVGPHGSIERCRSLLGPATRNLDAGELIWMTDKTPHESLPITSNTTQRRQFFRLVIGEVTAWFADHSTPNPTGFPLPANVRVVHGNKYELYNPNICKVLWMPGTHSQINTLRNQREVSDLLHACGLGHKADDLINVYGFDSLAKFVSQAGYVPQGPEPPQIYVSEFIRRMNIFSGREFDFEFLIFAKILSAACVAWDADDSPVEGKNIDHMVAHFKELLRSSDSLLW
jgi:hypothetical protein